MVPIKCGCCLIHGIYHQGIGGEIGADGTFERVTKQGAAKPHAPEVLIDGESPHPSRWDGRISRQFLTDILRQIGQRQPCCRQGVKTRDTIIPSNCHEAGGYPAPDILRDLPLEVVIESPGATTKQRAVVIGGERDDPEGPRTHSVSRSETSNWRRRSKARCKAGAGAGGESNALAKHS